MVRWIWVVEKLQWDGQWTPRPLLFATKQDALEHIQGCVKNAGYNRRKMRIVRFLRDGRRTPRAKDQKR